MTHSHPKRDEPPMQRVKSYLGLALGIAVTLFALQNLQATPVYFLLWYVRLPLVVTVLASAAIGALCASLWIGFARRRKRHLATGDAFAESAQTTPATH